MKDKLFFISVLTFVFLLGYNLSDVYSYPWFARRLVDNCNKCHNAFPKNNDYGQYVKATGYELPEISYEGLEESPIRSAGPLKYVHADAPFPCSPTYRRERRGRSVVHRAQQLAGDMSGIGPLEECRNATGKRA